MSAVPRVEVDTVSRWCFDGITPKHKNNRSQRYYNMETNSNEEKLDAYLDSFLEEKTNNNSNTNYTLEDRKLWKTRVKCCGSLHSFYCSECCRILIPKSLWPTSIQNGTFSLPCHLHIVLDDRRKSSSGIQAVAMAKASSTNSSNVDVSPTNSNDDDSADNREGKKTVKLIDIRGGEKLPSYYNHMTDPEESECIVGDDINRPIDDKGNSFPNTMESSHHRLTGNSLHNYEQQQQRQKGLTCLLFPSPGESVPLSEVASDIETLVVLDCKWTKTRLMSDPSLAKLQKVHLSNPPLESRFWRWHNAGQGMLSTVEAIYFATLEIAEEKQQQQKEDYILKETSTNATPCDYGQIEELIHIMWLFGIQRAVISGAGMKHRTGERHFMPFTAAGKEEQRALRRQADARIETT